MRSSKSVAYQSNDYREGLKSTKQLIQEVQTTSACPVGDICCDLPSVLYIL